MKILDEVPNFLDDNGESEEGYVVVETTIDELAQLNIGTCCGITGNTAFVALKNEGFGTSRVIGWYNAKTKDVMGMIHIEISDEYQADKISDIAYDAGGGGSLRSNGKSRKNGFYEFEIE